MCYEKNHIAESLLECGSSQEFELKLETIGEIRSDDFIIVLRGLSKHPEYIKPLIKFVKRGMFDSILTEPFHDICSVLSGKNDIRDFMRFAVLDEYIHGMPTLDYNWKSNPDVKERKKAEKNFSSDIRSLFRIIVSRIEKSYGTGIPSVDNFKRRFVR